LESHPIVAQEGPPHQDVFHLHRHTEDRNLHSLLDRGQLVPVGEGRKGQPSRTGGLALDDRNDRGKAFLVHIPDEFQSIQPIEQALGPGLQDALDPGGFRSVLCGLGGQRGHHYPGKGEAFLSVSLDEVHEVDGVDTEVGVVPKHGLLVVHLVVFAFGLPVGPEGLAPPQVPVQRHDQKPHVRVSPHMHLALAL